MKNCVIWLALVLIFTHVAAARDLSDVKLRPTIGAHAGQYSPDGKLYMTALPDLMLYDAASHKLLRVIPCQGIPLGFDFSRDSTKVVVLLMKEPTHPKKREYQLAMIGVADGKEIFRTDLPCKDYNNMIRIHPNEQLFALKSGMTITVVDQKGKISWEWETPKENKNRERDFDVTDDWKYFLLGLQRVSYPSKETLPHIAFDKSRPDSYFFSAVISEDGAKAAAVGGGNGSICRYFDLISGKLLKEYKTKSTGSVVATRDFKTIITDCSVYYTQEDSIVYVKTDLNFGMTDILALNPVNSEVTVRGTYYKLANASKIKNYKDCDGQWIPFARSRYEFGKTRGDIIVRDPYDPYGYNLLTKTSIALPRPTYGEKVVKSSDGAIGVNRMLQLVNLRDKTKPPIDFLPKGSRRKTPLRSNPWVSFSGNGQLATLAFDGSKWLMHVYDIKKAKILNSFPIPAGTGRPIDFSTDGKYIACSSSRYQDSRFQVLNAVTGKEMLPQVYSYRFNFMPRASALFTKDAKNYILARGKTIDVYSTDTWKQVRTITLPRGWIMSITSSADGKQLLVNSCYNRGLIIDVTTGTIVNTVISTAPENFVIFDKTGKVIVEKGDVASIFEK